MDKQSLKTKVKKLDVQPKSIVVVRLANPNPKMAKAIAAEVEGHVRHACPQWQGRILMMPMDMSVEIIPPEALEGAGWIRSWEPIPVAMTA